MTYPAAKLRGTNRAAIATSISSLAKSLAVYFVAVSIDTAIIAENNMDADIQENPPYRYWVICFSDGPV